MDFILPILFFFVAVLYSSVGLGGGSSYTALMAIWGINYQLIPTTSLTLNLLVTLIAFISFWRGNHLRLQLVLPFLITSIPLSFIGGILHLDKNIFYVLLLISLIFVALRIYTIQDLRWKTSVSQKLVLPSSLVLGAVLGFVAGAVGIGGGVFLVPVIIMMGLGDEKEAATAGTLFIWVNSAVGLFARMQRGALDLDFMFPLIGAVFLGGLVGSYMGSFQFQPRTIQKMMGIVVVTAIVLLTRKMMI
ncbi:MAG: TSUP family transporter [Fidelibacterota bacterium]